MSNKLIPATTGVGIESVELLYEFETDETGIYNGSIEKVLFLGIDILGCLSEDTINELESSAEKWLDDYIRESIYEVSIERYEERNEYIAP